MFSKSPSLATVKNLPVVNFNLNKARHVFLISSHAVEDLHFIERGSNTSDHSTVLAFHGCSEVNDLNE